MPKLKHPAAKKPAAKKPKGPRVEIVSLKEAGERSGQGYFVIYRAVKAGTLHGVQLVPGGRYTVDMREIYSKYRRDEAE
jgi:hypothetical protein